MRFILPLLMVLATSIPVAADDTDDAVREELRALAGTWKAASLEAGGAALPIEAAGGFTFTVGADGKAAGKSAQGAYDAKMVVDPRKTPRTIDLLHESGAHEGKRQFGIYKLEEDRWTVCITAPGAAEADRPKSFDTTGTTSVVFVFEREADERAERDAAVLQAVFDDMLRKDNLESPLEWRRGQDPVYVSRIPNQRKLRAGDILGRHDEKKWKALNQAQLDAAAEAAADLVARVERGDPLPELRSTSGRVKVYEEAGAATRPSQENPWDVARPSLVCPPGYSEDGRYAVVTLGFPWSGPMHSGEVTYILERTATGWTVLLSDFIYYV